MEFAGIQSMTHQNFHHIQKITLRYDSVWGVSSEM